MNPAQRPLWGHHAASSKSHASPPTLCVPSTREIRRLLPIKVGGLQLVPWPSPYSLGRVPGLHVPSSSMGPGICLIQSQTGRWPLSVPRDASGLQVFFRVWVGDTLTNDFPDPGKFPSQKGKFYSVFRALVSAVSHNNPCAKGARFGVAYRAPFTDMPRPMQASLGTREATSVWT